MPKIKVCTGNEDADVVLKAFVLFDHPRTTEAYGQLCMKLIGRGDAGYKAFRDGCRWVQLQKQRGFTIDDFTF